MPDKNKQKIDFKLSWIGLKRHLGPYKGSIILISVLGILSAIFNGFVPYITGKFFDELILLSSGNATDSNLPTWITILLTWLLIQFISNNLDWFIDREQRKKSAEMQIGIQTKGFAHLMKLPMSFHKNVQINKTIEEISAASWRIRNLFTNVVTIAPQILSVLVGIVLAATINQMMAIVLMSGVIIYVITLFFIVPKNSKYDIQTHEGWNESWDLGASANQQIESVKQSIAEDYEINRVEQSYRNKALVPWIKSEMIWNNVSFFQRTLVYLTQLVIFILSVFYISKGAISVGELVALNGYAAMFFGPFVQLGFGWQYIQNGLIKAGGVERIFSKPTEVYQPKNGVEKEIEGNIEFEDVHFTYEEGQPEVLKGINLKVNKGEVIALVGESGTGKSTTIQLISGYYFPTKGKVKVEGVETNNLFLNSLRESIAVVPQEVALFNDTIENNIKYGNFEASIDDVKRAAREAHIEDFIESLPEKYETLVGDRGIKLSVGQKQRVAIARAILRNPKILILDEPTSALDSKTEKIITESLEKLMTGRTTFIIAHRLSTVRKADRIIVFDKGKIVEQGSHDDLLKKDNGVYKRLHDYQIGLY